MSTWKKTTITAILAALLAAGAASTQAWAASGSASADATSTGGSTRCSATVTVDGVTRTSHDCGATVKVGDSAAFSDAGSGSGDVAWPDFQDWFDAH
jgi:hypothetical protein